MAKTPNVETKISLFGNFGRLNIGNECTLQAIIHNVPIFLPRAEMNCICSNPEDVKARHHISAFPMSHRISGALSGESSPRRNLRLLRFLRLVFVRIPSELREWIRTISILRGRDMLIMTGTGMLTDCGVGALGLPYEIFKWTMAGKICRIKIMFVSVGVEPMRSRLTRWLIKSSLYVADYIGYRDHHSKQCMEKMGFHKGGAVYPDLAFSLPELVSPSGRTGAVSKPVVGVGLFDYCGREDDEESVQSPYRGYLEKIGIFTKWLVENNYPVRILIGDVLYDNPVREDLKRSLGKMGIIYGEHRIVDEPISSVQDLFEQIEATDLVVATRFHNVLIALMLAKPVVSISYNEKNDALMADSGLGRYCQHIADFDVARLKELFAMSQNHAAEIRVQIKTRNEAYRKALDAQYRNIFNIG